MNKEFRDTYKLQNVVTNEVIIMTSKWMTNHNYGRESTRFSIQLNTICKALKWSDCTNCQFKDREWRDA